MSDLTAIIRKYRFYLYQTAGEDSNGNPAFCKNYIGADQCSRPNGCLCRKLAEIKGNIEYTIPEQYRELSIQNLTGMVVDKNKNIQSVWSNEDRVRIQNDLRKYLFDGEEIARLSTREAMNKASKMDTRFNDGDNVVIHGDAIRLKLGASSRSLPAGKTLIASLIIKEAIWRRLYASNRADTYSMVSFHTLKQDLKQKTDKANDLKECDWLVIDDITLPANELDFNYQSFVALFESFLITRLENKLPTILICDFDVESQDYSKFMGYAFQKIISANNTWLIKVGGQG